jgi:enediyne polyketide synthase
MRGEIRDSHLTISAGVSAMGFGGINSHVVVASPQTPPDLRIAPALNETALLASAQDSELFVFGAASLRDLRQRLHSLRSVVAEISVAELSDLSESLLAELQTLPAHANVRAAIVADTPEVLLRRMDILLSVETADGPEVWLRVSTNQERPARVAFVCPGQGSQDIYMGRWLIERDPTLAEMAQKWLASAERSTGIDVQHALYPVLNPLDDSGRAAARAHLANTALAQPALCMLSSLWAQKLARFGVFPSVVAGHSLGELSALSLAGAYGTETLMHLAARRGQYMTTPSQEGSEAKPVAGMTSLQTDPETARQWCAQLAAYAAIANINGARQVVVAGTTTALDALEVLAAQAGIKFKRLPVTNGFHSALVDEAAHAIRNDLSLPDSVQRLDIPVLSTVGEVSFSTSLRHHVAEHARSQVDFVSLLQRVAAQADLIIEVGAGRVLSGLSESILGAQGLKCLPVEGVAGRTSDLHAVLASAWIRGVNIVWSELNAHRLIRPFVAPQERVFIVNPCEALQNRNAVSNVRVASSSGVHTSTSNTVAPTLATSSSVNTSVGGAASVQEVLSVLTTHIVMRTGFDPSTVGSTARLRDDLNLDSIKAGEIIATTAQTFGVADRIDPAQLSNHPLSEISAALVAAGATSVNLGTASADAHRPASTTSVAIQSIVNPALSANDIVKSLIALVSERTGFASESIGAHHRLREDLNLDSIKAGEIIASAAQSFEVADRIDPAQLSNHPLDEIAQALLAAGAHSTAAVLTPVAIAQSFTMPVVAIGSIPQQSTIAARPTVVTVDPAELLIQIVVERTGFARDSISADLRLREDLNLDSIKAGEIIATAASELGVADRIDPAQLSNHPIVEIAAALMSARATSNDQSMSAATSIANTVSTVSTVPTSTAPSTSSLAAVGAPKPAAMTKASAPAPQHWVRSFGLRAVPVSYESSWKTTQIVARVIAKEPDGLQTALTDAGVRIDDLNASTLIVDVTGDIVERVGLLTQAVAAMQVGIHSVLFVQHTDGRFGLNQAGSGQSVHAFARSISQERTKLAIGVVDLADGMPLSALMNYLPVKPGFSAIGVDHLGHWSLQAMPLPLLQVQRPEPLQAGELVLVTGGARGITAACAALLARQVGVRLALVGSTPREKVDEEVLRSLGQLTLDGVEARYWCCDLGDANAVRELIVQVRQTQGNIAVVIHGAGRNQPRRAEQLSAQQVLDEMSPKVFGARHLFDALADAPPRLFCAFTSIIGVSGMIGNAWYAFANETLDMELAAFCERHSQTVPLSIAYGVWDEIGMGAKLGSVATLARMGIGALSPEEGTSRFLDLITHDPGLRQVVVTANVDGISTWPAPVADDTGLRFLDGERVGVPSVDCRVRLKLNPERDVYLRDHVFGGSLLFPTVFGLEAMAQVATAAHTGCYDGDGTGNGSYNEIVHVSDIALPAPIVVGESGTSIDILAMVRESDPHIVDCEVRTEMTGFARAHFRATVHFGQRAVMTDVFLPTLPKLEKPLEPKQDLYGGLLFQGARFQKMGTITHAIERKMMFNGAVDAPDNSERWLLGDPYFRDTLLQSGQVLIPLDDALPVAIDRITLGAGNAAIGQRGIYSTIDRSVDRSHFGTVQVVNADGQLMEQIDGYEVRILAHHPDRPSFADMLQPSDTDQTRLRQRLAHLCQQRQLQTPKLAFAWQALHQYPRNERHQWMRPVLASLDASLELDWAASGKPLTTAGRAVSIAHDDQASLLVLDDAGVQALGCDMEPIRVRDAALLGASLRELMASLRSGGDQQDVAITRAWAIGEALFKAGAPELTLRVVWRDGDAVEVQAGQYRVISFVAALARGPRRIIALASSTIVEREIDIAQFEHSLVTEQVTQLRHDAMQTASLIDPACHRVLLQRGNPDRMETRFVIPFDESGSLAGKVPAWALASWMGRLRELALTGLKHALRETLSSGLYGMVTEQAGVTLTGEAAALDVIEAHTWVEALTGGSCILRFAFHRVEGDTRLPVGEAFQRFGWVEVMGHGLIRAGTFPAFLRDFLSSLHHDSPQPNVTPLLVPVGPALGRIVTTTTMVESNIVGNLYFSHSFKWPNRVLDQVLWKKNPSLFRARGQLGELLILSQRVEYLREAMPFDDVEAVVHVEQIEGSELTLAVVYQRPESNGIPTRLALGQIKARWVHRDAEGIAHPSAIPQGLFDTSNAAHITPNSIGTSMYRPSDELI